MPARHILIPIHDFSAGGTELIAFRLARSWLESGRRVSILAGASDGSLRSRVPDGVEVHVLNPERPRTPTSRLFLGKPVARAAKEIAPDLIFLPGNFHFILGRTLKAALPHVPIVAKISNPLIRPMLSPVARMPLRLLTGGIDWFAAMSRGLADEARHQLHHRRVSALYDPNFEDDARMDFARRPSPGVNDPIRLVAIGRLEPQKDFALALEVVALLSRNHDVSLQIFGEGSQRAMLEKRAARLGVQDIVTFRGFSTDLSEAYARADQLLITSRYEGGPATAVEALAMGVPLVATDCSHFLREFIVNPGFGTLVSSRRPEDFVRAIVAQQAQVRPGGSEVGSLLAPLRLSSAASAYLDLFDSLVQNGAP